VIYKLTVAYDGGGFVGWQRQAAGTSIQGLLEEALTELDGRPVSVMGAGRTDAGVHARGQVASVSIDRDIDPAALVRAANGRLPPSVRVLDAVHAPAGFHARFHARAKSYQYRIWNADVMSPFERTYAWHVAAPALDVDAMADAAAGMTGRRDFAALQAAGGDTRTTVRTIFSSRVERAPDAPLVTFDISGDGFLRHMVRNIVGTLVEVGRGRRPPAWVATVLESRDRAAAGPTAPAEGLFLMAVSYE
jgi:tRNA pseudouridine38-40 synthase